MTRLFFWAPVEKKSDSFDKSPVVVSSNHLSRLHSMMCVPLPTESIAQCPGSLRRGSRQPSLADRRIASAPRRPAGQVRPLQHLEPTDTSYLPRQAHWNRSQSCQPLGPRPSQSSGSEQYDAWATDVEWRRPISSSAIPTPSNSSMSPAFPGEPYLPMNISSSSDQAHPSSNQSGRQIERPILPRHNTDVVSIQRRFWDEPAFRGNSDYQLFVEATFGLSQEQPRPSSSSLPSPAEFVEHASVPQYPSERRFRSGSTPTQLAQLQQRASDTSLVYRANSHSPRQQSFYGSETYRQSNELLVGVRTNSLDESSEEDQLPNYAQSQAEMQHRSRVEAVRRAQELQRRWRECNG
ncbi:hypothetical protein BDV97DRAFT_160237 [Delphinella strobiligena]|nr:hypothetical protein BDV97DRAFT_160237 [Delphinella strobiligena]